MIPPFAVVTDLLRHYASETPDADAFRFLANGEDLTDRVTYAGLDLRARSIAAALRSAGVVDQPVLLAYPPGLEFIGALFGCLYAGAIAVPVPVLFNQKASSRVAGIAADARPALGLTVESWRADLERAGGLRWLTTDTLPVEASAPGPVPPRDDRIVMLQYTSGTTQAPRGVMLSNRNLTANVRAEVAAMYDGIGTCAVTWLPMHHDMGLIGFMFAPLATGKAPVIMPPVSFIQRPARWLRAVQRYRASHICGPCFAFELCLKTIPPQQRAEFDLSSLRVVICGAEPIRAPVLEAFSAAFAVSGFNPATIVAAYGLAEATLLVSSSQGLRDVAIDPVALASGQVRPQVTAERARRIVVCGPVIPDHEIALVDPETHTRVPPDGIGEIWVRGASVAEGYWNRPEESRSTFQARIAGDEAAAAWLRTGDLGFMTPEGLAVTGRVKDVIVVRGANFDPLDIESRAQASHPALAQAASAAIAHDTDQGEVVVLVCELELGVLRKIDASQVAGAVAQALSEALGINLHDLAFIPAGSLPRTTSGKIRRQKVRSLYADGQLAGAVQADHPGLGRKRAAA
jgi:acyl-CoA synthetase (AMP-forming)/AMP-acid ligase II